MTTEEVKHETPASTASTLPPLRVRVINSDSGLFKDLLVEVRVGYTLFDAIYNTDAVKKANVRKWSSDVTQTVKNGTHEIQCDVKLSDNNNNGDSNNDKCLHSYSVNDLKITSTKQLYKLVGGDNSGNAMVILQLRCVKKPKGKAAFDHSTLLNQSSGTMLKCPFSGMEFDEDALKEFLKHKNS